MVNVQFLQGPESVLKIHAKQMQNVKINKNVARTVVVPFNVWHQLKQNVHTKTNNIQLDFFEKTIPARVVYV